MLMLLMATLIAVLSASDSKCQGKNHSADPTATYSDGTGHFIKVWGDSAAWCTANGSCGDRRMGLSDCSNEVLACVQLGYLPLLVDKRKLNTDEPYAAGSFNFTSVCLRHATAVESDCEVALIAFRETPRITTRFEANGYFVYDSNRGVLGISMYRGDGLPSDPASFPYWSFQSGTPLLDPDWNARSGRMCLPKIDAGSLETPSVPGQR